MHWIHLAHDGDRWYISMKLQVPYNVDKFLSSSVTVRISRTHLHDLVISRDSNSYSTQLPTAHLGTAVMYWTHIQAILGSIVSGWNTGYPDCGFS
jgi:hypothetical protein